MGGINPILEGDSFLAIQWGLGRLFILGGLRIGLRRCKIFQGAWEPTSIILLGKKNIVADSLSHEGVSSSSIFFLCLAIFYFILFLFFFCFRCVLSLFGFGDIEFYCYKKKTTISLQQIRDKFVDLLTNRKPSIVFPTLCIRLGCFFLFP